MSYKGELFDLETVESGFSVGPKPSELMSVESGTAGLMRRLRGEWPRDTGEKRPDITYAVLISLMDGLKKEIADALVRGEHSLKLVVIEGLIKKHSEKLSIPVEPVKPKSKSKKTASTFLDGIAKIKD